MRAGTDNGHLCERRGGYDSLECPEDPGHYSRNIDEILLVLHGRTNEISLHGEKGNEGHTKSSG